MRNFWPRSLASEHLPIPRAMSEQRPVASPHSSTVGISVRRQFPPLPPATIREETWRTTPSGIARCGGSREVDRSCPASTSSNRYAHHFSVAVRAADNEGQRPSPGKSEKQKLETRSGESRYSLLSTCVRRVPFALLSGVVLRNLVTS